MSSHDLRLPYTHTHTHTHTQERDQKHVCRTELEVGALAPTQELALAGKEGNMNTENNFKNKGKGRQATGICVNFVILIRREKGR